MMFLGLKFVAEGRVKIGLLLLKERSKGLEKRVN